MIRFLRRLANKRTKVELRVLTYAAPVQIVGVMYGKSVYLRERGGYWAFGYGEDEGSAVEMATLSTVASGFCEEFMDVDDAIDLTLALGNIHLRK